MNEDEIEESQEATQLTIREETKEVIPIMTSAVTNDDVEMLEQPVRAKAKRAPRFVSDKHGPVE